MHPRLSLVVAALIITLSGAVPLAQTTGAASPQEAVAAVQKATAAGNILLALPVISPAGQKVIAGDAVTGVLMVLAFTDPDDAMPGSKPTKAELDSKRRQYQQAKALATQALKPYGLDTLFGKPVLADDTQKTLNAALDKADNTALITSIFTSLEKMAPLLGMKEKPQPDPLLKAPTVTEYKVTGETATARNGAETIRFVRIGGRWYFEPAAPGGSGGPSAAAPEPGQPAAPRATASGKEPEVVAGAIQIVKVTMPDNDGLGRPFQADNGTTLVLWVKLPAGQGLIELDEDASVLQNVSDDKGSNMGGKFGSFPKEFKDGSGGTIEIESSGFPASGATAILAEGTLSMRIATGTRKTRVAKVALQDNAKLTLGKTPIVVADVQSQDDSQTFTLKLPRQVMTEIKQVVFLDAKGQPIEGRSTGSGYMNDAAEMNFTVKTAAKTLTLEFEMWQGLRTVKVPFNVKAGLGLN